MSTYRAELLSSRFSNTTLTVFFRAQAMPEQSSLSLGVAPSYLSIESAEPSIRVDQFQGWRDGLCAQHGRY